MASLFAVDRGGDVSVNVRTTRSTMRGAETAASGAGAIDVAADAAVVSFAGAASSQVIVTQQSPPSVAAVIAVSDRCEQHGIRVQKPMIAASGAIPAISSTIARLSDLRVIVIRFTETANTSETFRRLGEDGPDRRESRSPRDVSFITTWLAQMPLAKPA